MHSVGDQLSLLVPPSLEYLPRRSAWPRERQLHAGRAFLPAPSPDPDPARGVAIRNRKTTTAYSPAGSGQRTRFLYVRRAENWEERRKAK